jgi:lipoprotein-anchoring transpeptidase ErfK/SrfK
MNRRILWFIFAGILAAIVLSIGAGGVVFLTQNYSQRYTDRIYPGVSVYGVDLGGLTVGEAAAVLQSSLPNPAALTVALRDGNRIWSRSWANLGIHFEPQATARLAYRVGREGTPEQQRTAQLQALVAGWPLSPVIVLPDPAQTAAVLEELAPETTVPPVDASLVIAPEGITPVPAQVGRELDVEATIAALPQAIHIGPEGLVMELLTRQVAPAIANPHPAQAQAEAALAQPFTLSGEDKLTSFNETWTIEPREVAEWLTAQPVENEGGARLVLMAQEEAIQATLENLNSQLSDEITINIERTAPRIREAIEAGESQATAALRHPSRTYIVQPGDTLMSVARAHGFPAWRLSEANPDIDPEDLHPGQEITIPSIDVLFPEPLIMERRIVIDISDQHLYAYEEETLVYDYICSTGIASSPTITGTFQVLSKEEEAYASSWNLWMPHFIGIYHSGPDFTNGIHGLPTRAGVLVSWRLGHPASFGCIVIGLDEAATLYEWAELGTLVVIQD